MRQLILDIRPDAPARFENFLPGPNAEPIAALRERASPAAPFAGDHVLYLWGDAGVGKSHLLRAWSALAHAPYLARGGLSVSDTPCLAVDDAGALDEDDQVRLFSLLNAAREHGGRLVVAGTAPPGRMALRPDLATRLAQGLVFRVLPLSDLDKAAALAVRAEAHGLLLPEDVVRYMLTHCRRDLAHLLAMVDRLDTLSLSRKRPVSLPMLKELLQATATA